MNWALVADVVAGTCMILGALLALVAAIGQLRMPDLLSRMHPATKPQVLGLLLVLLGVALRLRDPSAFGILFLVGLFQLVTTPVASHMVGRAAFRSSQIPNDRLVIDELNHGQAPSEKDRDAR